MTMDPDGLTALEVIIVPTSCFSWEGGRRGLQPCTSCSHCCTACDSRSVIGSGFRWHENLEVWYGWSYEEEWRAIAEIKLEEIVGIKVESLALIMLDGGTWLDIVVDKRTVPYSYVAWRPPIMIFSLSPIVTTAHVLRNGQNNVDSATQQASPLATSSRTSRGNKVNRNLFLNMLNTVYALCVYSIWI